jgi:hypothetical protein
VHKSIIKNPKNLKRKDMTIQDKISIANIILGTLNFLVILATAIIVWIYTRATQRSNEIQEEPLLNLCFEEIHTGGARMGKLFLKNIGKGPAYSISFEKFNLKNYVYTFYLENRLLETGEKVIVKSIAKTPDGGTEFTESDNNLWFLSRLVTKTIKTKSVTENTAFFVINYVGSNRKNYYTMFAFYPDIPAVGDMQVQFLKRGQGKASIKEAKLIWENIDKITSPFQN